MALWKYAKLSTNNAPFVYQCSELIDVDGEEAVEVCNFCLKALEKLGMRWGPSHTEIKYSSKGPRLIEVNARWHGQNFVSICKNCIGYDAITLSLDCYYNPSKSVNPFKTCQHLIFFLFFLEILGRFEEIPRIPSKTKAYGRIVHLICSKSGTINMVRHLKEIQSLKSFHYLHLPYEAGDKICQTKDIRTDMGYVLLIHESKSVLDEDYDKVLQLQPTMIDVFDLKL